MSRAVAAAGGTAGRPELSAAMAQAERTLRRNLQAMDEYLPDLAVRLRARLNAGLKCELAVTPEGTFDLYYADAAHSPVSPDCSYSSNASSAGRWFYGSSGPRAKAFGQLQQQLASLQMQLPNFEYAYNENCELHTRYMNECAAFELPELSVDIDVSTVSLPGCLLLGVGLGYLLEQVYARLRVLNLMVIEPDEEVFAASLLVFDWAGLLSAYAQPQRGLLLLVGAEPEEVFFHVRQFYAQRGPFLAGARLWLKHYASRELELIERFLADHNFLLTRTFGFIDDGLFALSSAAQLLLDGRRFVRSGAQLPPELAAFPVCIIGNGPSLNADLGFLRAHQEKLVIVACGTAVFPLYSAGIAVDVYCAAERLQITSEALDVIPDQNYVRRMVCVGMEMMHPDTAAHFDHHALWVKNLEASGSWMERLTQALDLPPVGHLSYGGPLVGNLGLDVMLSLGCREIYLFGIDCGTRYEGEIHAGDRRIYRGLKTFDARMAGNLGERQPGNFGGEVMCDKLYANARLALEEVLQIHSDARCVNCADGALIRGAAPRHSAELDFAARARLDKARFRQVLSEALTVRLPLTAEVIHETLAPDDYAAVTAPVLKALLPMGSRDEYIFMMTSVTRMLAELDRELRYQYLCRLLTGECQYFFLRILRALYSYADEPRCLKLAGQILKRLRYCLEDAGRMYEHLPAYVNGWHRRLLKGKIGFDHPESAAPAVTEKQDVFPPGSEAGLPPHCPLPEGVYL